MQVWEAFHRHFFHQYKVHRQSSSDCQTISHLGSETMFQKVRDMLLLCSEKCMENQNFEKYAQYTQAMESEYECMYEEVNNFFGGAV